METMEREALDGARFFPDNPQAAGEFDMLAEEIGGPDTLRIQQAMLLADLVRGNALKAMLQADIASRGIGEEARNGRQKYYRENKSVTTLMKIMDQQRRTMQALGLIARDGGRSRKDDAEGDDFEDF